MPQDNHLFKLLETMRALRDTENGCPWDIEQDFKSIAPHTIEEAYEVADAIEKDDMTALKEELGDLLLQVVYHSRIAEEMGLFNFDEVAQTINDKMVYRHPHVFGDQKAAESDDVDTIWENQKDKEKKTKDHESVLDEVAIALPALLRAYKLQKKAARKGFEWIKLDDILSKLDEEISEFKETIKKDQHKSDIENEIGDVLFVLANIGRHYGINPETALRNTNDKFCNRFKGMEKDLQASNEEFKDQNIEDLLNLWNKQKDKEISG